MPTAHKPVSLNTHAGLPSPEQGSSTPLTWIRRQLLLVPEAAPLIVLLGLHSLGAPRPLLALVGLAVALYFSTRMALLALGRHALASADFDRAGRLAYAAATLNPASADAQALRGAIFLARGEAALAVDALSRAVALFPPQADLHAALSDALLEHGRPQEARAAAQVALALKPESAAAHLRLATAEERLGAPTEHVEDLLQAGLALPALPAEESALHCALAALLMRQGRLAEARLALTKAEQLLATCPAAQRASLHFYLDELLRLSAEPDSAAHHSSKSAATHGR